MTPRFLRLLLAVLLAAPALPASALEKYAGGPVVAELVTRLLEQTHYARRPIDDAVSREHLRNFIDAFDYNHMILEGSDAAEFESKYATTLDDRLRDGDVEPAYEIYDRVVKRLEERVELVKRLTAQEHDFDKDESAVLDRHELPWPADKAAAEELWRLRIKNEILQERLNRRKKDAPASKPEVAKSTAPAAKEQSIKEVVDQRYERLLRSYKENEGIDVFETFLSALTRVFDPHTDYLAAAQKENFDISMKLSLVGIGAVLRTEDGYARIVSLVPGGPADADKRLKPDDKVEAVAQGDGPFVEVVGMKLDRLVQMIRGEKGSTVRLRVIPAAAADPSERTVIALVRDEIKLTDQEAKAKIYTVPGKGGKSAKVGVLDLPSFYADMRGGDGAKSATRDSERLIAEMKKRGVDALIVDLRRDGGGSLTEAVTLSGLFIKEGPVVQVKDTRGTIKLLRDGDPAVAYDGALIVLASRGSASASEIFAGAMQDYGRGIVVGEKSTFGKGTVQSVLELNQYLPPAYRSYKPGALKLTIQKFYRVNGASTQHRGVLPDLHLPYYGDMSESIESEQKNALPYDEVEPAPYRPTPGLSARLDALAKASARRVASSREFRWVQDDLKRLEKQKKDKSVTLNESKRLAERKSDESRLEARKKERSSNPEKPFPSEEITLALLDGKAPEPPAASTAPAPGAAPTASDEDAREDAAAPDAVLDETLRVAADLAAALPAPAPAVARTTEPGAR
jgi:carboxyl-terminal processing protease